jgi:hypothetical protein
MLTVVIPQLLWLPVVRRNQILLFLISGGIIVGMWLERYMFTTASLEHNYMPSYWGSLKWVFAGAGFFWLLFLYGLSMTDYADRQGWPPIHASRGTGASQSSK